MTDTAENLADTLDGSEIEETTTHEETPGTEEQSQAVENESQAPEAKEQKNTIPPGLLEERRKRQELENSIRDNYIPKEESAKQLQELESRMRELWDERNKPEPTSFEQDPANFLREKLEQMEARFNEEGGKLSKKTEEMELYNQQQRQIAEITNTLRSQETNFQKQHQDYYDALDYLKELEYKKYERLGYGRQDAEQHINSSFFQTAIAAMNQGVNPAEYMYSVAQDIGYRKPEINDQDAKRLDQLEKAQNASKSLGANGLPSDTEQEEEDIDEFTAAWTQAQRENGIIR